MKKEPPKNTSFFIYLKGRYFIMGHPIVVNVAVFSDTSLAFLKSVVLQLFPKYRQSYANLSVKKGQNSTALKK